MDEEEALRRLAQARVGRLATCGADGVPHVVPFVFAVEGRTLYWAVDRKPKRSVRLKRLENIATNPNVSFVVDHYDEDWTELWWVRATGTARVVDAEEEHATALALLTAKFPQYAAEPPEGSVVAIVLQHVQGWEAMRSPEEQGSAE
jgi:PPOX class probable F420-dependent enzyme